VEFLNFGKTKRNRKESVESAIRDSCCKRIFMSDDNKM